MPLPPLLKALRKENQPLPLPETFLFGVATSDHQCESYQPEREDIRDVWERERGLTMRGAATDFEHRYKEDIALARELGCTAFRFSVAWSRVEPSPGVFDGAVLDHYASLVNAIRSAGMQPVLTLHHFTWPLHVEQRGGLIADDFPAWFERYTLELARRLGQDVRFWVTFNEPSQVVFGYIKPWWQTHYFVPPGLPEGTSFELQIEAVGTLMRNLFQAHRLARQAIQRLHPQAQVGANPLLLGLPVWLQRLVNWNATRLRTRRDFIRQGQRFVERSLLEKGLVDVIMAALTRTSERARQVAFSIVYFTAGQSLLVKSGQGLDPGQDLRGESVAVVKSTTAEGRLPVLLPGARAFPVSDYAAAITALQQDQVKAILADDTILSGLAAQRLGRYQLLGDRLTSEPYAAAVALGNQELLDVVDMAIRSSIDSGAWDESLARHFHHNSAVLPVSTHGSTVRSLSAYSGSPFVQGQARASIPPDLKGKIQPGPLPLARPGTLLRNIQDRGYLVAGVRTDIPGLGMRNPDTGALEGLEIDLARAVASRIFGDPSRVHFRSVPPSKRISSLRSPLRLLEPLQRHFSILSTIFASNWWHLGMAGKLAKFLCPPECVGQQDFVGFDYYWGIPALRIDRVQRLLDAAAGDFSRAPVYPEALYSHLREHARLFPGLPLLVVENGSVDVADNVDRTDYLKKHIRQVVRAVSDGIDVQAYICWSLTSNREWGLPFDPRSDFGLYHIELDSDAGLKRLRTPAAEVYTRIIQGRSV